MFTGLIEEVGHIISLQAYKDSFLLSLDAPRCAAVSQIGESIAVNGCCLTIVRIVGNHLEFNLLQETLECTNFSDLQPGSSVNCETALAVGDRLGGHFVQGHIDTTAAVISTSFSGKDRYLEIEIPSGFAHYLVPKGSIALNGVSLTVAQLKEHSFVVWVIPHTLRHTNLGALQIGESINLEFDVLAKHVERMGGYLFQRNPGKSVH